MKSIIRPIFSLMVMGAMIFPFAAQADAAKCSPCQLAKSIRDAAAQSIKDAQMAALAAGGSFARQSGADLEKCPCQKTCRGVISGELVLEKCSCGKTRRDEIAASIDVDVTRSIAACCAFCAQPGSLGCQGENSARCNTCQQGLIKMSIAEAAAAAALAQAEELDEIPADISRAVREELADPCGPCGEIIPIPGCCPDQLACIRAYFSIINQRILELEKDSKKCCKKTNHKLHDVKELIGDTDASVIDIPSCEEFFTVTDVINNTDVDVMTWLKSIYVLLYYTYNCTCNPCIG